MSTEAQKLIETCRRLGIRLRREGQLLKYRPKSRCTAELLQELRRHKPEVLALIDAEQPLPVDCKPWLHVARQVLHGEFDQAKGSTCQSVIRGLRSIERPLCQQAKTYLERNAHRT